MRSHIFFNFDDSERVADDRTSVVDAPYNSSSLIQRVEETHPCRITRAKEEVKAAMPTMTQVFVEIQSEPTDVAAQTLTGLSLTR
jgi:hypothetical protein